MENVYRVHQFAELAGVTIKALRHYDRLGLLKPVRSDAGYRLYRLADLARLQQIVALKSVGLRLKHIRTLLDRDPLPVIATFRQQRGVLEDKRRLLERAIQALADAEAALESGTPSTTAILQEVIKAMELQDIDVMKKYYSDETWAQWKHHYEDWPPEEWRKLYRNIIAAIDVDRRSPTAQTLADRCSRSFRVPCIARCTDWWRRGDQARHARRPFSPARMARWHEALHCLVVRDGCRHMAARDRLHRPHT